jgi:hypothetical protein
VNVDEFLEDFFAHAQPYDAAKRREYYLRTRKLKGRGGGGGTQAPSNTGVVGPNTRARQRREAAKVEAEKLRQRLDRLKEVLAELVDAAKARSGAEPDKDKPAKEEKSKDRKLTPKEKKEAAERAKESREKNPEKTSPSKEVEELRAQIDDIRVKIKVAMERAQKQTQRRAQRKRTASNRTFERPRQTAG